ncbi:MAG: aminoacyl-tRNA hydrolase [Alphaproteobacteria bacterium]|nr:aminoacyl-tRNA hydrolase [Alphaproteobacteria bacterium]
MQENKPILIVGLGNPGTEYELTRHNVGFMAIDALAPKDSGWKKEKNALTTRCEIDGHKVILAKPQTFMNNSGDAVLPLMTFYKIPLENLIVIHDDMDIRVGDKKEKIGGTSAGHNGIKSIDAAIGNEYKRIRIGIGHPRDFDSPIPPVDWVLGKLDTDQLKAIKSVIKTINI